MMNGVEMALSTEEQLQDQEYQGGDEEEEEYEYEDDEDIDDDQEEVEDAALKALKADEPAPRMPENYYADFDSFLSKPTPKFSAGADAGKSGSKKKSPDSVVLPRVGKSTAPNQKKSNISSKIKSKVAGSRAADAERLFDPELLQQAFDYADRVEKEAAIADDDDEGDVTDTRPRVKSMPAKSGSAPQLSKPKQSSNNVSHLNPYERQQLAMKKSTKKSSSSKKQAKEGVVKRLRSKTTTQVPSADAFSNISASSLENTRQKGGLDVDAMVRNFQNGTTLSRLKAELEASQQSIADSENFMRSLSKEYSSKRRR